MTSSNDLFVTHLQLLSAELDWTVSTLPPVELEAGGFLINPRRLRGSDFLMRWAQGRWSEDIVIRALNASGQYGVVPYGPSTVAPEDPTELERFFEQMDIVAKEGKRPDLLLYEKADFAIVANELSVRLGNIDALATTPSLPVRDLLTRARAGLEIENSLWLTERMPGFGKPFRRYIRGKNKGRLKASGIVPTIIVKEEDVPRLIQWQDDYRVPIYIVHIFFDRGYFVRFDDVLAWINAGDIGYETQRFSNPDGTASTSKQIVKVPYILCKAFGSVGGPTLVPRSFVDRNGKVMTYVTFEGGDIELDPAVYAEWPHES